MQKGRFPGEKRPDCAFYCELFRQFLRTLHAEVTRDNWRGSSRLSAADRERVVAFGNDGIAGFGHHAHIARVQLELHSLLCARLQMNALESAECFQRRARDLREGEVELDYFVARDLFAGVGYRGLGNQRAACGNLVGDLDVAVAERRVAQPIAEWVRAACRRSSDRCGPSLRSLRKCGNWLHAGVEGHGQAACRIVLPGERFVRPRRRPLRPEYQASRMALACSLAQFTAERRCRS